MNANLYRHLLSIYLSIYLCVFSLYLGLFIGPGIWGDPPRGLSNAHTTITRAKAGAGAGARAEAKANAKAARTRTRTPVSLCTCVYIICCIYAYVCSGICLYVCMFVSSYMLVWAAATFRTIMCRRQQCPLIASKHTRGWVGWSAFPLDERFIVWAPNNCFAFH